jgi:5-methylcytosine-specific restriction endonuclease McrA
LSAKEQEKAKEKAKEQETVQEKTTPVHIRRKNIPKHIKTLVWNKFIGSDIAQAKCMSCREEMISIRSFHCGHVIAESLGGDVTITNLRPICAACNASMGIQSMNEFTSSYFGWTV